MKTVNVEAHVSGLTPEQIYATLCDFSTYAGVCSAVRSVTVESEGVHQAISTWEVNFQSGILRWQERDEFFPHKLEIRFAQIVGDIDEFSGTWRVSGAPGHVRINFDACFDLGIPMLADMLDPIAESAIRHNIQEIIGSLFAANAVHVLAA
ncbi:MAG: SRPBCC family protein [Pseudomonadota bacterium]|nr:SRPBCC family protein [Pseudomonadota bacterium]